MAVEAKLRTRESRGARSFTAGQRATMVSAALGLAVWLVYLNTLSNPFVFDDHRLILENRPLVDGAGLAAIIWRDVTRPLVNLSYALDMAVWGSGPFGLHVTNVLLHALNVVLVFFTARALVGDAVAARSGDDEHAGGIDIAAATSAALFAIHPALTQAVVYISGRSELLCVALLLPALLRFRRFVRGGGVRWLAAGLVFWVGALTAKEVAAMLPFLLLAYDRLLVADGSAARRARLMRLHLPLIAVVIAAAGVRVWLLTAVEYVSAPFDGSLILVALDALRRYLWLVIAPAGQTIFHALPAIDSVADIRALTAFATLGALAAFAWLVARASGLVPFGICWFVLLLIPSSALFVLGRGEAMAEHRLYGASIGLFLVFGEATRSLVLRLAARRRPARVLFYTGLALMALQLAGRTLLRNAVWSDPVALWRESAAYAPDHWVPRLMLAETIRERDGCSAAEPEYRLAARLRPEETFPAQKLGACLIDLGRLSDAGAVFERLSRMAPASAEGPTGLALVAMAAGRPDESRRHLLEAIRRDAAAELPRRLLDTLDRAADQSP
jgi:hypothetical protein